MYYIIQHGPNNKIHIIADYNGYPIYFLNYEYALEAAKMREASTHYVCEVIESYTDNRKELH